MAPLLIDDVLELIISILFAIPDIPTLCNLSVVNQSFRLRLRTRLLRTAVVRYSQNPDSMLKCFDSNRDIYALVHVLSLEPGTLLETKSFSLLSRLRDFEHLGELCLQERTLNLWSSELKVFSMHPTLLHYIQSSAVNIHTLRLGPVFFASNAELARFLCAFPILRYLYLSDDLVLDHQQLDESLGLRMTGKVKLNTLQIANVPYRLTIYTTLSANLDHLTTLTIDLWSMCPDADRTLDEYIRDKLLSLQSLRDFTLLLPLHSSWLSAKHVSRLYDVYATILAIAFQKGASHFPLAGADLRASRDPMPTLLRNLAECRYVVRRGKTISSCVLSFVNSPEGSIPTEFSPPMEIDLHVLDESAQIFWAFLLGDLFSRLPSSGVVRIERLMMGKRVSSRDKRQSDSSFLCGDDSLSKLSNQPVSACIFVQHELKNRPHYDEVEGLAVSPDGTWVASGEMNGTIILWDARDQSVACRWRCGDDAEHYGIVAFSPDSRRLAFPNTRNGATVWDIDACRFDRPLATLSGHTELVNYIAWSPDGRKLATGSEDGTARIWDGQTYELLHVLELALHEASLPIIMFSPDGTLLASCGSPEQVKFVDVDTGQLKVEKRTGLESNCRTAAFDPEGRRVATGYVDGSVHIWDVQTGKELVNMHNCTKGVMDVSFSKDGREILYGSADGTVKILDSVSGDLLLSLEGHTEWVRRAQWSPDNRYIASASDDMTVRLWRRSDGRCMATFEEHTGWVRCLEFSPDGRTLSSGSKDGAVCIRVLRDIVPDYEL